MSNVNNIAKYGIERRFEGRRKCGEKKKKEKEGDATKMRR